MTTGLRKIHLYSWIILLIVVPGLLFFAIKDVQFHGLSQSHRYQNEVSETIEEKVWENDFVKLHLVPMDSILYMDVLLKKPTKHSSTNMYILVNMEKGPFIGQLNGVGKYKFQIPVDPEGILFYDDIKEEIITKIIF